MQPVINAPEIATAREQQLFNGKNFHVFIYNKTESISGLGNDSNLLIVFYVQRAFTDKQQIKRKAQSFD